MIIHIQMFGLKQYNTVHILSPKFDYSQIKHVSTTFTLCCRWHEFLWLPWFSCWVWWSLGWDGHVGPCSSTCFFLLWILSDKRLPVWGLCSKPKLPFDVMIPLYLLQSMVVIIVIKDFYRNTFGVGGTQIHSHYQILLGKIVCTFGPPALIFFFCWHHPLAHQIK